MTESPDRTAGRTALDTHVKASVSVDADVSRLVDDARRMRFAASGATACFWGLYVCDRADRVPSIAKRLRASIIAGLHAALIVPAGRDACTTWLRPGLTGSWANVCPSRSFAISSSATASCRLGAGCAAARNVDATCELFVHAIERSLR